MLSFAEYRTKWRDPQLDNERDLGTLSPKWDVFIKPFPSGLRKLCGRGSRKIIRARGGGRHQGNCLPELPKYNPAMESCEENSKCLWQHSKKHTTKASQLCFFKTEMFLEWNSVLPLGAAERSVLISDSLFLLVIDSQLNV